MFEFFTRQPLWAKAAIALGTGAVGYYGYQYFAGPSESRRVPRGGMGPVDAAASLPGPGATSPAPELGPTYGPQTIQGTLQVAPDFVEYDQVSSAWVPLPEHEWHRRFGEFVSRNGYAPPHMARPAPFMARPAPPMMRSAPPMGRPAPPSGHHQIRP